MNIKPPAKAAVAAPVLQEEEQETPCLWVDDTPLLLQNSCANICPLLNAVKTNVYVKGRAQKHGAAVQFCKKIRDCDYSNGSWNHHLQIVGKFTLWRRYLFYTWRQGYLVSNIVSTMKTHHSRNTARKGLNPPRVVRTRSNPHNE